MNKEDNGKFIEAKQLMDSAFNGRKKVLNRKIYNLARADYLDRFAFDALFTNQYITDKDITKVLGYFPDAIFLDHEFFAEEVISELISRENKKVKLVSIYARGKRKIDIMEDGYQEYIKMKENSKTSSNSNKQLVYNLQRRMPYKIGEDNSETLKLRLDEVSIK